MKKTLHGPMNVILELDTEEVIEDDPGAGTPAIVRFKGCSATYWYALGEAQVYGRGITLNLPPAVLHWLENQQSEVDSFLYP